MTTEFKNCIYCGAPAPLTAEHVIPDAIGGCWVLNCVCKACNSRLGDEVDVLLVDSFLARLARQALLIRGKKGAIPNVFEKGSVVLPGVGKHPVNYRMKPDGRPGRVEIVSRLAKDELDDGRTRVRAVADAAKSEQLFEAINKTLARRGLPPIARDVFERSIVRGSIEHPQMEINVEVGVNDHVPGLAKITYEAAAYWLGNAYVEADPIASLLREGTFSLEALEGHRGNVEIGFRIEGEPEDAGDRHLHTIMLVRYGATAVASVALFGNLFMSSFVVTDDPERYGFTTSRMIEMDSKKRTFVETDVPSDILREYFPGESVR